MIGPDMTNRDSVQTVPKFGKAHHGQIKEEIEHEQSFVSIAEV